MLFQNPGNLSDAEVYAAELKLARLAEPAGVDSIWCVEHHFTDYTMCPDVTQFLSYLAGCTSRIKLGTGAVILPWHDPLRVAEEIALLDYYSEGRTILGMGRGLARIEYEGFREDMNQSRTKFNEAAQMIVAALETGSLLGGNPPGWSGPPAPVVYLVMRSDAVDVVYGTPKGFEDLGIPYMPHILPPTNW